MLRADLRICRSLGVKFTDWLELDDFERTIWRAFDVYESDLCPGCGQPRSEALFDDKRKSQPKFSAGFTQCLACHELLRQQDAQRIKDARRQKQMGAAYKDTPELAPRVIAGHRHWLVQPAPPQEPDDGQEAR